MDEPYNGSKDFAIINILLAHFAYPNSSTHPLAGHQAKEWKDFLYYIALGEYARALSLINSLDFNTEELQYVAPIIKSICLDKK